MYRCDTIYSIRSHFVSCGEILTLIRQVTLYKWWMIFTKLSHFITTISPSNFYTTMKKQIIKFLYWLLNKLDTTTAYGIKHDALGKKYDIKKVSVTHVLHEHELIYSRIWERELEREIIRKLQDQLWQWLWDEKVLTLCVENTPHKITREYKLELLTLKQRI